MGTSDIVIGTLICRRTSFIIDKFLANQQEIQQAYPRCRLVLATDEPDFIGELREQFNRYHLQGEVIVYETVRPDYARSRVWSIACGREALRQYTLSDDAEYLLFLDSDMVYAKSIVSTMKARIQGFDVIYSGYRFPPRGDLRFGGGCLMVSRETLSKIPFRCKEFRNGQVICEDEAFDVDLFKCRGRVNKGIFVSVKHYKEKQAYVATEPQPVGWFRALTNSPVVRYIFIRISLLVKYNIPGNIHAWLYKAPMSFSSDEELAK